MMFLHCCHCDAKIHVLIGIIDESNPVYNPGGFGPGYADDLGDWEEFIDGTKHKYRLGLLIPNSQFNNFIKPADAPYPSDSYRDEIDHQIAGQSTQPRLSKQDIVDFYELVKGDIEPTSVTFIVDNSGSMTLSQIQPGYNEARAELEGEYPDLDLRPTITTSQERWVFDFQAAAEDLEGE